MRNGCSNLGLHELHRLTLRYVGLEIGTERIVSVLRYNLCLLCPDIGHKR